MTAGGPSSSGVDLARLALRQAKEAARQRGGQAPAQKAKRTVRLHRGDRRDPQALKGLLQQWLVDNGYEKAADGGSLLNRWPDIVGPERAAHWEAAAYDEASKTLTVVCQSDSWARMLSLVSRQIVDDVNRALKPGTLAAIRIRRGTYRPPARPEPTAPPPEPATRRVPPGTAPTAEYARVREQLQEAKAQRDAVAPRRQYERLTPDRIQADPDDHTEAQYFQQDLEEEARRKADSYARALRYARRQRAASSTTTPPTPRRSTGAA
ncbi:DciA family protein [Streptomyces sp. NPDC014986]|uniref:DciA family protein n=1 Tax=Streptomyces sp. NPDC014986 TaxID=3364934 RepID=UPI0036F7BBE9